MVKRPSPSAPLKGLPPLPKMTGKGTASRPRPIKKAPQRVFGPKIYKLDSRPQRLGKGPGEPPTGLVTQWTSKTEWYIYWALARVTGTPKDPRKPPFTGGTNWQYQKALDGGRQVRGGQVLDFVIWNGSRTIGIRVETERYHIFTSAQKQAEDFYQRTHSSGVDQVISIFDQDFMGDPSGAAACAVVATALKGIQPANPIRFGTARRVRA